MWHTRSPALQLPQTAGLPLRSMRVMPMQKDAVMGSRPNSPARLAKWAGTSYGCPGSTLRPSAAALTASASTVGLRSLDMPFMHNTTGSLLSRSI